MDDYHTLIPCEVSAGQFEEESAVTLHLIGGGKVTLFADKKLIEQKQNKTYLRVTKIKSSSKRKKNEEIVILPTEAFESGSRWLRKTGDQLAIP